METINKLLIMDMILLIMGMVILYIRPFGWDMIYGIIIIAAAIVLSFVLFLLKLNIWQKQNMTK